MQRQHIATALELPGQPARRDAFDRMCREADRLGANPIVGARYDATEVMPGITEVLCYGTAVRVNEAPPPLS